MEDRIGSPEASQQVLKSLLTGLLPGIAKDPDNLSGVGIHAQKVENQVVIRVERMMKIRHLRAQKPIKFRLRKHELTDTIREPLRIGREAIVLVRIEGSAGGDIESIL